MTTSRLPRVTHAAHVSETPNGATVDFQPRDRTETQRQSDDGRHAAQLAYVTRERDAARLQAVESGGAYWAQQYEAAKAAYQSALEQGDHATAADAQSAMTAAQSRLLQMQEGHESLSAQMRRPPPMGDVHSHIDSMTGVMDIERQYLHDHPDALTDPSKAERLRIAVQDAERRGIARGSSEMMDFVDERLGYERTPLLDPDDPNWRPRSPVTLTPAQVDAAKVSGISLEEYGLNLARAEEYRKRGYFRER